MTSLVAGYYLVGATKRFKRAYPNVNIRVIEDERPYIEHLLVSGEIDIGVLILSNLEDRHALQTEVLIHSPYRLWLPAQHPLLDHESISLADVAREVAAYSTECRRNGSYMLAAMDSARDCNRRSPENRSTEAVRSLVAAGMGVSILPDMAYRAWWLEGDMIEARPSSISTGALDIGLAWRRGSCAPDWSTPFLTVALENGNTHGLGCKPFDLIECHLQYLEFVDRRSRALSLDCIYKTVSSQ